MKTRILSFLAALCILPAVPSFAEELGKDDPGWTAQCVKQAEQEGEGTGTLVYARCMVEHRERLQAAQTALVGRIGRVLAGKGPEGTDYKAAKSGFAEAQRHWTAFIGEDCAVVGDVFGYGTAQGLAGEECLIAHYTARNQQLRDLEANYLNP